MQKSILIIFVLVAFTLDSYSQSNDELLNILVQKNLITQKNADSLKVETALAAQASFLNVNTLPLQTGRKVVMAGYTQVRYQALEEAGKADGFDIRRVRLDVKGSISDYWIYRVQFDLAGTPKLLDAYVELKLNDYLNFTVGQAKVPFSLENLTSSNKLESIDRSQVVEALTARGKDVGGNQNGRDIGLQIGGMILKVKDRGVVEYRIGLYNGSGINTSDLNEKKDYATRLILHPFVGLDLSAGLYNGSCTWAEIKTGNIATTASKTVDRQRYGFDVSYNLRNFTLRSEYIHGTDDLIEREGYYLQGGYYFFKKKFQLVARYDFYDTEKSISKNASTCYVLGTTYNINLNTRFQFNYRIKKVEGIGVDNNLASCQLQIGF